MSEVTQILGKIESGDQQASNELLPLVYEELRKLAAARMTAERPEHILQATALVHEAYLRLVDVEKAQQWDSRAHFFAAAGEAMRRILVDNARQRRALRHGGDRERDPLTDLESPESGTPLDLLALNDSIEALEKEHADAANVVKLRFLCGFTIAEVAESLGISHASVERYWAYARARLHNELAAD